MGFVVRRQLIREHAVRNAATNKNRRDGIVGFGMETVCVIILAVFAYKQLIEQLEEEEYAEEEDD